MLTVPKLTHHHQRNNTLTQPPSLRHNDKNHPNIPVSRLSN